MKYGKIFWSLLIILIYFSQVYGKLKETEVVALVNGEPITVKELLYVAGIEHRREDLPRRAKKPDLNKFLEELIRDTLIVQEAKSMGLETNPWYEAKVKEYIVTAAVRELYKDEILSRLKPDTSTLKKFYQENFYTYKLLFFQNKDKNEVEKAREKMLKNQGNFTTGEYTKVSLLNEKDLWEAVKNLKAGEVSEVIKLKNGYMVVKVLEIRPPNIKEFDKKRKSVEEAWKYVEKKRLEKLKLEALRKKYQSQIIVYRDKVKKFNDKEVCKNNKNLTEVLAKVGREELKAQQFCESLKENPHLSAEEYVSRWVDFRVIDLEALNRGYHLKDPLKEDIKNYKKQLLKRVFIGNIIAPKIKITEKDLKEYYEKHKNKFREENSYKLGRIVVDDHQTALKVLAELDKGADFYFLAEKFAKDEEIRKTRGVMGWLKESMIPDNYKRAFQKFTRGEIGMTQDGPHWTILKILEVKEGEIKPFKVVKESVEREVWNQKVEEVLNDYVKKLKKDAKIVVYHNKIKELEKTLFR